MQLGGVDQRQPGISPTCFDGVGLPVPRQLGTHARHLITITSPTRQWGSRDVYARPGDNVNTPRPVYGCIYHPMWLSTIRLSVLRLLVTVSYQPNVVYINGQACTCTQISIQSHPNVDPVSPKYRRLLTTIYAPKYRFQQVDISGVP